MWLGNLTRVTKLYLGNNSFTGQIPSSLSNLKDLTYLGLRYNNFGGRIPDLLTNLTKLTDAWLSYNQLTGSLTEEMERRAGRIIKDLGEEEVNAFKGAFRYIESDEYHLLY
ncbi:hypothetical protein FCV25MIE_26259 [Fagus crenata]